MESYYTELVSWYTGVGLADEAHSMEVLEELCGVCRGQGRWQDAPQQLTDLAELMQSYGFPTPGWGEEGDVGRAASHADTDMGSREVKWLPCTGCKASVGWCDWQNSNATAIS